MSVRKSFETIDGLVIPRVEQMDAPGDLVSKGFDPSVFLERRTHSVRLFMKTDTIRHLLQSANDDHPMIDTYLRTHPSRSTQLVMLGRNWSLVKNVDVYIHQFGLNTSHTSWFKLDPLTWGAMLEREVVGMDIQHINSSKGRSCRLHLVDRNDGLIRQCTLNPIDTPPALSSDHLPSTGQGSIHLSRLPEPWYKIFPVRHEGINASLYLDGGQTVLHASYFDAGFIYQSGDNRVKNPATHIEIPFQALSLLSPGKHVISESPSTISLMVDRDYKLVVRKTKQQADSPLVSYGLHLTVQLDHLMRLSEVIVKSFKDQSICPTYITIYPPEPDGSGSLVLGAKSEAGGHSKNVMSYEYIQSSDSLYIFKFIAKNKVTFPCSLLLRGLNAMRASGVDRVRFILALDELETDEQFRNNRIILLPEDEAVSHDAIAGEKLNAANYTCGVFLPLSIR